MTVIGGSFMNRNFVSIDTGISPSIDFSNIYSSHFSKSSINYNYNFVYFREKQDEYVLYFWNA